jgi:hypothetical protein
MRRLSQNTMVSPNTPYYPAVVQVDAIKCTNSIDSQSWANQIKEYQDLTDVNVWNNLQGLMTASDWWRRREVTDLIVGGGGPNFVFKPGENDLGKLEFNGESTQIRESLIFLMFLVIQELHGRNTGKDEINFAGICLHAQLLATALEAVTVLDEIEGIELSTIKSPEQLKSLLEKPQTSLETVIAHSSFQNPIAELETGETYIRKEEVLTPEDPLFEGLLTIDNEIEILHSNQQGILADTMKKTRAKLRAISDRNNPHHGPELESLAVRNGINVHTKDGIEKQQLATIFRFGKLLAIQGHPDYRTDSLADGYDAAYQPDENGKGYFRPLSGGTMDMPTLIQKLRDTPQEPNGSLLLSRIISQIRKAKEKTHLHLPQTARSLVRRSSLATWQTTPPKKRERPVHSAPLLFSDGPRKGHPFPGSTTPRGTRQRSVSRGYWTGN